MLDEIKATLNLKVLENPTVFYRDLSNAIPKYKQKSPKNKRKTDKNQLKCIKSTFYKPLTGCYYNNIMCKQTFVSAFSLSLQFSWLKIDL
jgi:hypothetical protein